MARQSLPKGPGRPWCEAVEVQRGLCWRPQDAEDPGTMGYLPKRAANGEWDQLKRKRYASGIKMGRAETWKPFDYMELVNLLIALLGFGFALFRYFLTRHATVSPF